MSEEFSNKINLDQVVKKSRKVALTKLITEAIKAKPPWTHLYSNYMFDESNEIMVALSNKAKYKITITEIK